MITRQIQILSSPIIVLRLCAPVMTCIASATLLHLLARIIARGITCRNTTHRETASALAVSFYMNTISFMSWRVELRPSLSLKDASTIIIIPTGIT